MNNTKPLNASNEFVINPKQVIEARAIAEKNSVLRCLTITHILAKCSDENSRKAEDKVDASAAA